MVSFTDRDVQRLARLARLALTPDETARFARQLADILDFVRQVQSVETAASSDINLPAGALRDDAVAPSLERGDALASAPEADAAGLFKVPRVLEG